MGRRGARFAANEKTSEKFRNLSIEEKRKIVEKRKIKSNNRCVDCGCLISPKTKQNNTERCRSCSASKRMKERWGKRDPIIRKFARGYLK